jgi:hypothetical protein
LPDKENYTERESVKIWAEVTKAIGENELELARKLKCSIENKQREEENFRLSNGETYVPNYFRMKEDTWSFILEEEFTVNPDNFDFQIDKLAKT